ncbi:MAG: hypothetical protein WDA18_07860 [Candidatus Ratteibacteria bacterium]|jgi:kynurenine formamidase
MKKWIDFTRPIPDIEGKNPTHREYIIPIVAAGRSLTGICHSFSFDGMSGTYIDFPGHIRECDNGIHAGNISIEPLLSMETTLIRLTLPLGKREITRKDLESTGVKVRGRALIVHVLGSYDDEDFPVKTLPYFSSDTFSFFTESNIMIFASDVYENRGAGGMTGIFEALFSAGILCICKLTNLHQIQGSYLTTSVLFNKHPGVVQLPCRFVGYEET